MNVEILKDFCSSDPTKKERLGEPWQRDGKIFATNGDVMLVLEAEKYPELTAIPDRENAPHAEKLLKSTPIPLEFFPCPELPVLPPIIQPEQCLKCGGTGSVDCSLCGQETWCDKCDGIGYDPPSSPLIVNGVLLDARDLSLFRRHFPDMEIGTNGPKKATVIRFKGGMGLIMPLYGAHNARDNPPATDLTDARRV